MNKNFNESAKNVGFIGCGKMASAIIKGVLKSGFLPKSSVVASEINEDFANARKESLNIEVFTDNKQVVKISDVVVLAIEPAHVKEVLEGIKDELNSSKLVVSIAAGVSTGTIEGIIGEVPVIRVMPNAPAMVLEGMSGIVKGKFATDKDAEFIEAMLSNIGKCIVVEESKIDVVTAISGSGPAFFYFMINEMAKAGEKLGLDFEKSLLLAAQTAIGSAKIMLSSELTPDELISNIATKGGCTQVGVDYLTGQNAGDLFFETVKRTAEKANALGK